MAAPPAAAAAAATSSSSPLLPSITISTLATIAAADNVLILHSTFASLSHHLILLLRLLPHLPPTPSDSLHLLSLSLSSAHSLALACARRNRLYLLLNSRRILDQLQSVTLDIADALSHLPLPESHHLSLNIRHLRFENSESAESILDNIKSAIANHTSDRSYANNFLALIAAALAIPNDPPALRWELDEFHSEIADAELRQDLAEVIQMDQFIALLGRADTALSFKEKEVNYLCRRNTLGDHPIEPLQSFYCPITGGLMEDPVETSSGHTFEKSAIEKWVADGNMNCPLTMVELDRGGLRPNITLRKSIEEWKERNTMITISTLKSKLGLSDDHEVLDGLNQLLVLCEERVAHREWVVLENYLPILVGLLNRKNPAIRTCSLSILCILANDNDYTKERIAEVDDAAKNIVHSLGRRGDERKLAVALLLELSKDNMVRRIIGKAQGCILLLVTILNSDNIEVANDTEDLLENLSVLDENVVQMAKAYYFKPLVRRLRSGPDDVKKTMVTTLAEMELTDHSKAAIFKDGALTQLIDLVSQGDTEMKTLSVKALQNLSSLQQNSLEMIKEGVIHPLLNLLYHLNVASSPDLREQAAETIMNIAIFTAPVMTSENLIFLDSDDVVRFFSLINFTGPSIQRSILGTFYAICRPPSAKETRAILKQCSAISVLIQHCEKIDPVVRANVVKLLFCLMEDSSDHMPTEPANQGCLKTLLSIIQTSGDVEEKAAALGIISNLPTGHTQIPQWLIDESLPVIVTFLSDASGNKLARNQLIENAVGALCHFTIPANPEGQKKTAEAGMIPLFVQLLQTGTDLTKRYAAISLAQLSDRSFELSRPVVKRRCFFCFSPRCCRVHMGVCSVKISFCLLEAKAVGPLVRLLDEPSPRVCEAALRALSTIIKGERLESGSKVLDGSNGIVPMIRLLSSNSMRVREKSLSVLERIFWLDEYKRKYGASAQMPLVYLTQRGTVTIRASAARILGHLKVADDKRSQTICMEASGKESTTTTPINAIEVDRAMFGEERQDPAAETSTKYVLATMV